MGSKSQGLPGGGPAGALGPKPAPGLAEAPAGAPGAGLVARAQAAYEAHPLLVTWLALAVGMVAILLWASRHTDLLFHQRLFLVLATVGLAGLCAWIIGWE